MIREAEMCPGTGTGAAQGAQVLLNAVLILEG